eukprot:tig00021127_g18882.t1
MAPPAAPWPHDLSSAAAVLLVDFPRIVADARPSYAMLATALLFEAGARGYLVFGKRDVVRTVRQGPKPVVFVAENPNVKGTLAPHSAVAQVVDMVRQLCAERGAAYWTALVPGQCLQRGEVPLSELLLRLFGTKGRLPCKLLLRELHGAGLATLPELYSGVLFFKKHCELTPRGHDMADLARTWTRSLEAAAAAPADPRVDLDLLRNARALVLLSFAAALGRAARPQPPARPPRPGAPSSPPPRRPAPPPEAGRTAQQAAGEGGCLAGLLAQPDEFHAPGLFRRARPCLAAATKVHQRRPAGRHLGPASFACGDAFVVPPQRPPKNPAEATVTAPGGHRHGTWRRPTPARHGATAALAAAALSAPPRPPRPPRPAPPALLCGGRPTRAAARRAASALDGGDGAYGDWGPGTLTAAASATAATAAAAAAGRGGGGDWGDSGVFDADAGHAAGAATAAGAAAAGAAGAAAATAAGRQWRRRRRRWLERGGGGGGDGGGGAAATGRRGDGAAAGTGRRWDGGAGAAISCRAPAATGATPVSSTPTPGTAATAAGAAAATVAAAAEAVTAAVGAAATGAEGAMEAAAG